MDLRLTEYEQTASLVGADDVYEPLTFNGTAPLLKLADRTFCVLRQSGRAVVWFGRMTPPAPLVASPRYLSKPKRETHRVKGKPWAWETVWEYVMAVDDTYVLNVVAAEAWPSAPVIT